MLWIWLWITLLFMPWVTAPESPALTRRPPYDPTHATIIRVEHAPQPGRTVIVQVDRTVPQPTP